MPVVVGKFSSDTSTASTRAFHLNAGRRRHSELRAFVSEASTSLLSVCGAVSNRIGHLRR